MLLNRTSLLAICVVLLAFVILGSIGKRVAKPKVRANPRQPRETQTEDAGEPAPKGTDQDPPPPQVVEPDPPAPKGAEPDPPPPRAVEPDPPAPRGPEPGPPAPRGPEPADPPAPRGPEPADPPAPRGPEPDPPAPRGPEPADPPAPRGPESDPPAPRVAEPDPPAPTVAKGRALATPVILPTEIQAIPYHGDGKCDDFDSPTRPDPFPTSIKWAQFVKQMDKLVAELKTAALSFTSVLAEAKSETTTQVPAARMMTLPSRTFHPKPATTTVRAAPPPKSRRVSPQLPKPRPRPQPPPRKPRPPPPRRRPPPPPRPRPRPPSPKRPNIFLESFERMAQDSNEGEYGDMIVSIELEPGESWKKKRKRRDALLTKWAAVQTEAVKQSAADNKSAVLTNFINIFKPVAALITPVDKTLLFNRAWTRIDPAVGLTSITKVIDLAKTNPTATIEKARIKWIEVNAMAATVHHVFDRLTPNLEKYGLSEVGDAMDIEYPSWITTAVLNETGIGYFAMTSTDLTEYVHKEMDALGDKYHLIQALERILCRYYGYKDWDPSKDRLNRYCFGNSKPYDLIHDNWDVLIDAAKYLVASDCKYALAHLAHQVYKNYRIEAGEDEAGNASKPVDLKEFFEATMKNMTERIDKKIKFSQLAALPTGVVIVEGPFIFHCSPTPSSTTDGNCTQNNQIGHCPPGVFIRNNAVYHNNEQLQIPKNLLDSVTLPDGTPLTCLRLERVGINANGTEVPCNYQQGKCVNANGTALVDVVEVKVVPRLVDADGAPLHRGNDPEEFEAGSQWGLYNCSKCAKAQHGIIPECPYPETGLIPGGTGVPPGGLIPGGPNGTGAGGVPPGSPQCEKPKCHETDKTRLCGEHGFVDCRRPGLDPENSFALEGAIQGYLESELVLQPESKCLGTCQEYKRPTPTCTNKANCNLLRRSHCESADSDCMANSKCPNNAKRCIKTSRHITFCPALNGTGKIYDWVNISGVVTQAIGLNEAKNQTAVFDPLNPPCATKIQRANERWAMEQGIILNTVQYCEICYCICMDPMTSEAYYNFDIAALKSDIANGFVITGMRFEKHNKTVFLNIQQGKLLPGKIVDKSTLAWLDPTAHTADLRQFGSADGQWKRINLDIIEPSDELDLITGISWKIVNNTLNLEVGFSSYDKVLAAGEPKFRGPVYPPPAANRKAIPLEDTISPIKQLGPAQPYPVTHNDHYIEFDATSLIKDGAAAVVPFFDALPLHSHDGEFRPFRNLEILFKSKEGYGGFLSLAAKF